MAGVPPTDTAVNFMSKEGLAYLNKYYPEDANGIRAVPPKVDVDQQRNDWNALTIMDHEAIMGQFSQASPPREGARRSRRGKKSRASKTRKGGRRHKKSKASRRR